MDHYKLDSSLKISQLNNVLLVVRNVMNTLMSSWIRTTPGDGPVIFDFTMSLFHDKGPKQSDLVLGARRTCPIVMHATLQSES